MKAQRYFTVNWKDGMKINKSHFLAQENAFTYQQAQHTASGLNEYNYGLLPTAGVNGTELSFYLSLDNQQQVQLRIQHLFAVTRGGHFIQVEQDTGIHGENLGAGLLNLDVPFKDIKGKTAEYYVVITIDPYQRTPFGSADPLEQPARLPYTIPSLYLSLLAEQDATKNLLGLFQLPVGKITVANQVVALQEDYIPPCNTVGSHNALLEIHAGLEQFYAKMEVYALQIIQKIIQKRQDNEMAGIVQKICENVTTLTATHLAELKAVSLFKPPVELVCMLSSFARSIKNTLDHYAGSGKEELINYCTEWCEVSAGELENAITTLANHQYDHLNMNRSIEKISSFTHIISHLFANLARLEYIGKRKEMGIFVKEKVLVREPEPAFTRRGSFLAE